MKRLLIILLLVAGPMWAVQPDEVLLNPALEARARALSKGLRCLVCRSESIDESNAPFARDLRLLVRERLTAGDSDDQVIAFLVDRYGEFVLLQPRTTGANWLLWGAGPLMLILAGGLGGLYLRRRSRSDAAAAAPLTDEESQRLARLLKDN
jgi:cytochrome c-type biogenesis protein CcmH